MSDSFPFVPFFLCAFNYQAVQLNGLKWFGLKAGHVFYIYKKKVFKGSCMYVLFYKNKIQFDQSHRVFRPMKII